MTQKGLVVLAFILGAVAQPGLAADTTGSNWSKVADGQTGERTGSVLLHAWLKIRDRAKHLHGSCEACDQHCWAWALLYNFSPWHPVTAEDSHGWQSPGERLDQHRYRDNWLENLLISASLGECRNHPHQNP